MRILAISGSLRKGSYNRALLEAAKRVAPESVEVEIYEDGLSLPLFNQDSEGDLTPRPVLELRSRIRAADAVLIASPEYNSSIPGVLKNLIVNGGEIMYRRGGVERVDGQHKRPP